MLKPGDFDWEKVFGQEGARWLHTGGILAALSDHCAGVVRAACQAARDPSRVPMAAASPAGELAATPRPSCSITRSGSMSVTTGTPLIQACRYEFGKPSTSEVLTSNFARPYKSLVSEYDRRP